MKKIIFSFALISIFSCTFLKAQNPTLQEVTDNGNETNDAIKITNANGIKVINPNITTGYNSIFFGQSGSSTQYLRLLPQNTDGSLLFANSFYFDLTNEFWGVNGDFLFEGIPQFNKVINLSIGAGNGAHFGTDWKGYVSTGVDEFLLTKTATGGAELKIKNIDGNYLNSHFLIGGKVGIGTGTIPSDYKLAVAGKAIMEEVKVALSGAWPDYVFSPTYSLRSLEETEAFIKENNHLPEIPSAKEVEENGLELGEMNKLLLKKIEELTLYQIEMMKLIQMQQEEINKLKIK
jgi:hypothetical protein